MFAGSHQGSQERVKLARKLDLRV